MTKGFAPILKLAVKSQAKRAEKRHLTPLGDIQANLLNYVAEIPDPRVQRTQKHSLKDILVISILAVIGGAEGWEDMENYGIAKQQWLEEFLELPNGIPSDDTFRRVFERINPEDERTMFSEVASKYAWFDSWRDYPHRWQKC